MDYQNQYIQQPQAQFQQNPQGIPRKYILIAVAIIFLLIVVVIFVLGGSGPAKTYTAYGPVGFNASKADIVEDDLAFYSGSTFATLNGDSFNTDSITEYFSMPSVVDIKFNDNYVLLETSNHSPGTKMFSLLFNNPDTISKIDKNHFWALEIATGKFTHLSSVVDGNVNSIGGGSSTRFSTVIQTSDTSSPEGGSIELSTKIFELFSDGEIGEVIEFDGQYRLIDSTDNYSILFQEKYFLLNHDTSDLREIPHSFGSRPFLLSNGDLIASLVIEDEVTDTLGENSENGHDDEVSGVYLIDNSSFEAKELSESKGTIVSYTDKDGVVVIRESTEESIILETHLLQQGSVISETIQINSANISGLQKIGELNNGNLMIVDGVGAVFVASQTSLDIQQKTEPSPRKICTEAYCVDPVSSDTVKVSIFSGEIELVKNRVISDIISSGEDPTSIKINWVDLRTVSN